MDAARNIPDDRRAVAKISANFLGIIFYYTAQLLPRKAEVKPLDNIIVQQKQEEPSYALFLLLGKVHAVSYGKQKLCGLAGFYHVQK